MNEQTFPTIHEQMVRDWVRTGIRRLELHLSRHAAFEEYCRGSRRLACEETPCPPKRR
jgi:hypothetical protein